jgi:hypothetical protein
MAGRPFRQRQKENMMIDLPDHLNAIYWANKRKRERREEIAAGLVDIGVDTTALDERTECTECPWFSAAPGHFTGTRCYTPNMQACPSTPYDFDEDGELVIHGQRLTADETWAMIQAYLDGLCPCCGTTINQYETVCDDCLGKAQRYRLHGPPVDYR